MVMTRRVSLDPPLAEVFGEYLFKVVPEGQEVLVVPPIPW
jgi:hypothetical protein